MFALPYQPQRAFAALRTDRGLEVAYVIARSEYPMHVEEIRSKVKGGHCVTPRAIRHIVTRLARAALLDHIIGRFGRFEYLAKPRLRQIIVAGGVTPPRPRQATPVRAKRGVPEAPRRRVEAAVDLDVAVAV